MDDILILRNKATKEEVVKISKCFKGYVKVVVDTKRNKLCAGADRHVDEEKMLLDDGSSQSDIWGGGIDLETGEIDYNSMINLRPNQENPSRDILSKEIRTIFDKVVNKVLK